MSSEGKTINNKQDTMVEPSFIQVVKKQYLFKLNAYSGMFTTMIVLQLLAIFFSINGNMVGYGAGSNNIFININLISANMTFTFTLIWIFIMAIQLTTKEAKNTIVTFVSDKKSNHTSNILLLLTMSGIGGVTAFLAGYFLKMSIHVIEGSDKIIFTESITALDFLFGIVTACLYLCLFSALGYLISEIVQFNKVFAFILPVIVFGFLIIYSENESGIVAKTIRFFINEQNIGFFFLKIVGFSAVLFILASIITHRLEVRK